MIADEGAASAAGLLRGDVISSIGGVPMEAPHHAAETLRQSEGYVHLGVLYPFASMDLSVEANESKPIVSPRQSIGAGKPILGGSSEDRSRSCVLRSPRFYVVDRLGDIGRRRHG